MPGPSFASPVWPQFVGICGVFAGTPGTDLSHSADSATPLMTEGSYASVRFILFIPFEEKALIDARGDEYRSYMSVVRYRVFRGVWWARAAVAST